MRVPRHPSTMWLLTALTSLTVAGAARAGSVPSGTVEIAPTFAYSHTSVSGASNTIVSGGGVLGYATSDLIEPRLKVSVEHFQIGSDIAGTTTQMTAGALVNLPVSGSVVPFVDLGAGFVRFGDTTSSILPEVGAGVRALVGNSASVNVGLSYERQSDEGTTTHVVLISLGVSFFLGRPR